MLLTGLRGVGKTVLLNEIERLAKTNGYRTISIEMQSTLFVFLGGILAALAVGLGAFGAHALKSQLTAEQLTTFQMAVQYQMYHAIGLVLIGLLEQYRRSPWFDGAGYSMLIGIILFSGLLYAWLATGRRFFVYPVPVGGLAFIIGWVLLAIGALGLGQK